jgi:ADP-heptose:LPS heptosyltransferase
MSDGTPSTIAVVQLGRLGDMVLTTPLIEALDTLYPDARITVIAGAATSAIARYAPGVGDVFEVGRGALALGGAVMRLRMRAFDLYIDPKDHHSSTSRMLARSTRALRVIAHPSNAPSRFEPLPPSAPPGHYVDRMLAPLRVLAPDHAPSRRPRMGLPADATIAASRVRAQLGEAYAAVNVSAGVASRYWTVDRTIALVQWIARTMPVAILAAPADRRMAHGIATTAAGILAADTNSLLEVAAIVAGASIVVSPDTSVIHVASAYDRPTVGLYPFNPDNLRLFAPLATRNAAVVAPPDGTVADIDVEEVRAAVERVGFYASTPA